MISLAVAYAAGTVTGWVVAHGRIARRSQHRNRTLDPAAVKDVGRATTTAVDLQELLSTAMSLSVATMNLSGFEPSQIGTSGYGDRSIAECTLSAEIHRLIGVMDRQAAGASDRELADGVAAFTTACKAVEMSRGARIETARRLEEMRRSNERLSHLISSRRASGDRA